MQAHSTMRGKRPKIIDVDLLSDVSSPKCHSPKSPRIKEEELDDIEEMQVEAQVEEDVMGSSDAKRKVYSVFSTVFCLSCCLLLV